jgi:signal transduction histidine kinase
MPDEPLVVLADRLRLGQAIQNILGNAIKFTPDGGAIGVAVLRSAKSIRIEVTDSGIGIAESDIAHIFEMFYSVGGVHGPTTGFGIGLALAAKLVALQGGSISASSDGLGRGSTFVIELPLAATLQAA